MSSAARRNIQGNTDVGTNCSEPFQRAHVRNAQHVRPSWRFYSGQAGMQLDGRILVAGTWLRMTASYHEGYVVSLHVRQARHCGAMGQSTLEQCTSVIASLASYTLEDVDSGFGLSHFSGWLAQIGIPRFRRDTRLRRNFFESSLDILLRFMMI